jgi:hypothetical protein
MKVKKDPVVPGSYKQVTDQFRKQVRREAEKYSRKLGFKSSGSKSMLAQVQNEVRFWEQAHEIDVYAVDDDDCKGRGLGKEYSLAGVARLRAVCALHGILELEESELEWDEIDTLDGCRTTLLNWYAKAAPPPATISLMEFAKRTGLSIEEVKRLKPERIAGFYVDDKGETRVDFARFERRFGIREEEAA